MRRRSAALGRIEGNDFDVCVIGGGATGAGCALDAQLRGLRTVLVEAADFASGSSSASTKMAHGGVRYLQQAVRDLDRQQFRLVAHALEERARMLHNAPHLTRPLEFVVPCFNHWEQFYFGAGLKVYEWIAGKASLFPSRFLSREEALRRVPAMKADGLIGAVTYADGQFDDARYALAILTSFADAGGEPLNYARVVGFGRDVPGRITAGEVEDRASGRRFAIRARAFVNATGPVSDTIRQMASPGARRRMRPSKGVHLLFPLDGFSENDALLVPRTEDGRVIFAIPWRGRLLVGTTDDAWNPGDETRITRAEVEYLLRQLNPYLVRRLTPDQVVSGFAGIRPLVAREAAPGQPVETKKLIRDDEVEFDAASGLISILGGKWTTYRRMAERTVDRVQEYLGGPVTACPTRDFRLAGSGVAKDTMRSQVVYAVRHEMAVTMEDVLARRTGLELFSWRDAVKAAPMVGRWMQEELGWVDGERDRMVAGYQKRIGQMMETAGLTA